MLLLDVVLFVFLAVSAISNLIQPSTPKEAFLGGATWEATALAILGSATKKRTVKSQP
jgi:hypothetical protein